MSVKYRIIPIGGGGGITPSGTINITENGTHNVARYATAVVQVEDEGPDYLRFTSDSPTWQASYVKNNGVNPNIEYSTDKSTWYSWDGTAVNLTSADTLYLRGFNPYGLSARIYAGTNFNFTTSSNDTYIYADGNVYTLIDYIVEGNTLPEYAFNSLFINCSKLRTAPKLPTNIGLENYCYENMFRGCTSLITAPDISDCFWPDQIRKTYCFYNMFYGCTSLTSISRFPALGASSMSGSIFEGMYYGCTSLTGTLDLSYITDASKYPFQCDGGIGVFNGTNYTKIDLSGLTEITTDFAFKRAFKYMPSLEEVDLSNLTLIHGQACLEEAFQGCTSLKTVKLNSLSSLDTPSTYGPMMRTFDNCTSLESIDLSNLTTVAGQGGALNGFYFTFASCSSLKEVKIGVASYNSQYYYQWLDGVSSTGDFYNLGNAPFNIGFNGIPANWTVHTS